ncbi:MAG: FmdB family zinc ribbon protein [Luteimonas sp.]
MPIYAFQCSTCQHSYDRLQKLSDPDPEVCPECGAHTLKRQLSAPSFRLAGSGWYETDFKKDGDKKRNLAEASEGAGKSEAKPAADASKPADKPAATVAKTETKPAAKTEAKPTPKPASSDT